MIISIVCCDKNYGIGKDNSLLFSLPSDMKFFRETTKGHVVAMGKKTLLSFPNQKPLKNRTNIVLSHNDEFEGCINVHSFEMFLKEIKERNLKEDVYIIGGASIYQKTIEYVDKVLLTKVDEEKDSDVYFPNLDNNKNFKCVYESDTLCENDLKFKFTTYLNLNKKEI